MPTPTLLNGVAATLESRAYQGPGIGEQMVAMAEAFSRVKEAHQAAASKKLEVMLNNVDKLPIDDKAIRKVAKQAGLPLADDSTIAAIAQAGKQSKQAQQSQPGAPSATIQPTGGKATSPDAAAADATKKFQQNMTPEQGKNMVFETWAAKARQLSAARNESETSKAQLETKITQLKTAAATGDGQAAGKLMSIGEIPFNISQLGWQQATPEQRNKVYDIAMGHETDAQKAERETSIFNSLIQHGNLSAADAVGVSRALANGQALTAEQTKKMGEPSFKKLSDEASFMDQLIQIGVPADKIQSTAAAGVASGSLVGALPKGLQPIMQKELELRNRQLSLEGARVGVEKDRLGVAKGQLKVAEDREARLLKENSYKREATNAKLHLAEVTGENKAFLDAYKIMITQKKAGIQVDPKALQGVIDKLQPYGVDMEHFNYMTGQQSPTAAGGNPVDDELGAPK